MNNHYHVVIETPQANLAIGMRYLNGVYTQTFNSHHNLTGHVFQGRYHSALVDKESYLLEVCRYVVLNPVRAGLVETASQWRWSSHNAVLGIDSVPAWLSWGRLLRMFAARRKTAIDRYQEFVSQGGEVALPWVNLSDISVLGSEEFAQSVREKVGLKEADEMTEFKLSDRQLVAKPLDWYVLNVEDAKEAMVQAFESGAFTMKEIGARFGVHYTTVSRAIRANHKRKRNWP